LPPFAALVSIRDPLMFERAACEVDRAALGIGAGTVVEVAAVPAAAVLAVKVLSVMITFPSQ